MNKLLNEEVRSARSGYSIWDKVDLEVGEYVISGNIQGSVPRKVSNPETTGYPATLNTLRLARTSNH
jgi:hypothetical protein